VPAPPLDKSIDIGAIVARVQLDRIKRLVDQGVADGAPAQAAPNRIAIAYLYRRAQDASRRSSTLVLFDQSAPASTGRTSRVLGSGRDVARAGVGR